MKEQALRKIVREELIKEQDDYSFLSNQIEFSRKPADWDYIETNAVQGDHLKDVINSLPVYRPSSPEINHSDESPNFVEFTRKLPKQFLYKFDGDTYLIQPEGYDYPRYIAKII